MASLLRVSIFLLALATAAYCLPANFQFGMATASYQVEGAWNISRGTLPRLQPGRYALPSLSPPSWHCLTTHRTIYYFFLSDFLTSFPHPSVGLSIWDTFSHTPGKVADGATGDVADDFYHKYYNDIKLMHQYGITHFRLSISWSRIMRTGSGPVNPEGIAFYNGLINALLASGITPAVTLFHWDMPQGLEDAYGSWLDDQIIPDFTAYADACFGAFGDRVKYWFTFNEPLTFANLGYGTGGNAPGRCSDRSRCSAGNSTTEPWIVGHRVILAHASAYALYQSKYKSIQGGKVGIVLNSDWAEPYTSSADDVYAAQCALDYSLGWWADPIWYGDYPHAMKEQLGSLLPRFTPTEKIFIKGSYDFFALNHYTSRYVSSVNRTVANPAGTRFHDRNPQGVPIGPVAESSWLIVVPWGFEKLLDYVWNRYFTPIVVTENGVDVPGENSMPIKEVRSQAKQHSS